MKFTTGEVISAGLGVLCCKMEDVYKIMNFLTSDNLFTHQLPRACKAMEPWVLEQCPWLKELDASKCNPETVHTWLADAVTRFGKTHELQPAPANLWLHIDPIKEAVDMTGGKVIVAQKE
jgi:hypothetical protein